MTTETNTGSSAANAFKQAQVRYRRHADNPDRLDDLNDMVDFGRCGDDPRIIRIHFKEEHPAVSFYGLQGYGGFLYAPQVLPLELRLQLAHNAVSTYCERPHKTNIDLQSPRPSEITIDDDISMWDLWKHQHGFSSSTKTNKEMAFLSADKRWYKSFAKLSWATMGYNYDWTARMYHDHDRSPIPSDLARLSQYFAAAAEAAAATLCQHDHNQNNIMSNHNQQQQPSFIVSSRFPTTFSPSACIVNYYHSKSIMGGHRDDSELAVEKPIVSFSMGRAAVFLLGGPTRNDAAVVPILVRPGDVMIMGGKTRLNYHAMARLLPVEGLPQVDERLIPPRNDNGIDVDVVPQLEHVVPESELPALYEFLKSHRININLRQVYPD